MSEIDADAFKVHITNVDELTAQPSLEIVPEHFSCVTFVVQQGGVNPRQRVLETDPTRKSASILAVDAPVVLCHTLTQAMQPANQVAAVPNPDGGYLPAGTSASVDGTGPLWVVATTAVASRVTVIINRRGNA